MPGPPPPPPPGGLPPPPTFVPPPPSKGDPRDALLKSIRSGANLKKAVTVDKSGPYIPGKVSNSSNNSSSNNGGDRSTSLGRPNGLVGFGSLFPGGQIPKLRAVGGNSNSQNSNGHTLPHQKSPEVSVQQKNFANTQNEIKRRMANDNRNRGPPPPAPSRTPSAEDSITPRRGAPPVRNGSGNHNHVKPSAVADLSTMTYERNHSSLHKRAVSNTSIGITDTGDSTRNNNFHPKPSYGKPNVAPKPPALNEKVKPLNRTQSMKNPRSPSPQSPAIEKNISNFGTVRNLKPELKEALAGIHQQKLRPPISERPKAPPPSIPQNFNPSTPPPPNKAIKHPGHAPPPPPSMVQATSQPPPVPPHRTAPNVPPRTCPPPPPSSNVNGAPPPPPRFNSMKDSTLNRQSSTPSDFELRFENKFRDVQDFPRPIKFSGVVKIYSGKPVPTT